MIEVEDDIDLEGQAVVITKLIQNTSPAVDSFESHSFKTAKC